MDDNLYKRVTELLEIKFKENEEREALIIVNKELIIDSKELIFQIGEKADRAAELIIAIKEIPFKVEKKIR